MADTLTFAVPVEWSKTTAYEQNIIVFVGKKAYTSLKAVPTGIEITDTSYWAETGVPDTTQLKADIETLKGNVSTLQSDLSTTNSNVTANNNAITSIRQDITNATTEEEYDRQVLAGTYQGRSLMAILGASSWEDCYAMLSARAKRMDSSGIRIGDYIDVTPTSDTVNMGNAMRYRVAGMGHNYQFGDTACPWAFWMMPDDPINMTGSKYADNTSYIYWNTTGNNNGTADEMHPYLLSKLHDWEIIEFLPALPTALMNVLMSHRILLEERYSASGALTSGNIYATDEAHIYATDEALKERYSASGALTDSTLWSWVDAGKVFSLNEMEVYGCPVWGTIGWSVGEAAQLPLFRDSRYRIKSRTAWWLRSVKAGSVSNVCTVWASGTAGISTTFTNTRPRPCFLIG